MSHHKDTPVSKSKFALVAGKAIEHPLVQAVMTEYARNMGFDPKTGLPAYGMMKVAMYAAQVARAQALGLDPELLRTTTDEAAEAQLERARSSVAAGIPTIITSADPGYVVCDQLIDPETNEHCEYDGYPPIINGYWRCPGCGTRRRYRRYTPNGADR